ncbi:MAG: Hpt domain-containing protein [Oscillospiraceae bacterium]|nr:Hpt domain-containing protein [Oscillospiraceae bacterium]
MNISIEGINTPEGLARFAGNEKLYVKSLLRFASEYPPPAPEADAESLKKYAHTIKGIAGNLGIYGLAEAAAEAEQNLPALERYAFFASRMREMCALINLKIPPPNDGARSAGSKPGGKDEYAVLSEGLKKAASEFNPSDCERIIDELYAYDWVGVHVPDLGALRKAAENYDFDDLIVILDKV